MGWKIPVPPESKIRWAPFQVVPWALPLLTVKVPVCPPPQSKVPVNELGALLGAAAASDAEKPKTPSDSAAEPSRARP